MDFYSCRNNAVVVFIIDKYQVCINPRRKSITLLQVHHDVIKMHCTTDQADGINVKMHHYCKTKAGNFTVIPGDTSLLKTPLKKDGYIYIKQMRQSRHEKNGAESLYKKLPSPDNL